MKLVQACLNARGDEESILSLLCRGCDARTSLFMCQEGRKRSFHHCGGLVKLLQGGLSASKDREKNFHHCGSAVKFVKACLSIRKDRESSFHHCVCAG